MWQALRNFLGRQLIQPRQYQGPYYQTEMQMSTEMAVANVPGKGAKSAANACLIVAWICFLIPLPGLGLFVGWPLNFVAFLLAVFGMAQGGAKMGLWQLIQSLIVSPIVYAIGWAFLLDGLK